jgi:hypothetical protein
LVGSRNQSKTPFWLFVRFYQRELEIHHLENPPKSGTAARFSVSMGINLRFPFSSFLFIINLFNLRPKPQTFQVLARSVILFPSVIRWDSKTSSLVAIPTKPSLRDCSTPNLRPWPPGRTRVDRTSAHRREPPGTALTARYGRAWSLPARSRRGLRVRDCQPPCT